MARKLLQIKPYKNIKLPKEVIEIQKNAAKNSKPLTNDEAIKMIDKGFSRLALMRGDEMSTGFNFHLNNRIFCGTTPDPVDCYFGIAYTFFVRTQEIEQHLMTMNINPLFGVTIIQDNSFYAYIQYRSSCIIMLYSTLETFINRQIPSDETLIIDKKELNKEQMERLGMEVKIKKVIPMITNINFVKAHSTLYNDILGLGTLRNELIHLKTVKDGKKEHIESVYNDLLEVNLQKALNDVENYVNLIEPNSITYLYK